MACPCSAPVMNEFPSVVPSLLMTERLAVHGSRAIPGLPCRRKLNLLLGQRLLEAVSSEISVSVHAESVLLCFSSIICRFYFLFRLKRMYFIQSHALLRQFLLVPHQIRRRNAAAYEGISSGMQGLISEGRDQQSPILSPLHPLHQPSGILHQKLCGPGN